MVVYFFSCKKFIFFSKTEKDKAAHEIGYLKKNKIKLIPFGPFETYAYHSVKSLQIFEKHSYFLFLGTPMKYKGLDIFLKLSRDKRLSSFKFVIAERIPQNLKLRMKIKI